VRIAILGIGLIGGSLAAALRARGVTATIVGCAPGGDAARAQEIGLVDEAFTDPVAAVRGADWVVLAAPVPVMGSLMAQIAPALGAATRITDCGSTKRSVVESARAAFGSAFSRYVAGRQSRPLPRPPLGALSGQ
jgi:prephenate dehydrogenase